MHPYESLREKLVQPFLLLGFIVSAALSLITFGLLAQIEERAIERALHAELESFRYRVSLNAQATPASGTLLRGYYLPDPALPGIRPIAAGQEDIAIRSVGDAECSVLRSDIDGRPFALIYDRHYVQSNMQQLALLLLIATACMSALSFLVGHRLSRKVVQPILRLVDDVSRKASEPHLEEQETSFSEADYPPDEIGRLVRELDRFSHRLYGALQRESYFASDVSHELRTPVTVIMGAAEVLAELPGHSTMAEQRIEVIHRQAARMGQMLNAMLLLGREDSLENDPACSIADVIDEAVADCRPSLAGRPIELRVSCTAYPILAVERALVYVLVSNLLRNACAHTHQGTIEVRLHEDCFEVADTGIGIPDERFSEFMQRHVKGEHSQGHGLGLSIVARVCDRLGWRFSIASNAGQGTIARLHWSATGTP